MADLANLEERNAKFLLNSHTRMKAMVAPDGTAYTEGALRRFTVPVLPGWAKFIRVFFELTVNVVVGGGAAAASVAAPYNIFSGLRLKYGGVEHRNHHGYILKLLKQTAEHDGGFWSYGGPTTEGYAATIYTTTPVANGNNTWRGYMDIPLQMQPGSVMGMLPMGSAASPITLELDCTNQWDGTDPLLNPVIVTGGATSTVTGTISAAVYYAYGQSTHDPRVRIDPPIIGSFAKIVQNEVTVANTTGVTYAELKEPYPHLKVFQTLIIPGAADFVTFANIAAARFDLDAGTEYLNYGADGGTINGLWYDQRERYGQDLDPGVVVWDFISGSDPEHPDGMNIVNVGMYNAARCGIHYNGALAAASNRILTAAMFVEPLPF